MDFLDELDQFYWELVNVTASSSVILTKCEDKMKVIMFTHLYAYGMYM